jgi:alkylated DNA repair dioxygenase AlkB
MTTHKLGKIAYGIDDAQFVYIRDAVDCTGAEYEELRAVLLGNPKRNVRVCGMTHHPKTGKPFKRPRHEGVWGKDYTYSGVTLKQQPEPNKLVEKVMHHANKGRAQPFTWALCNLYENGEDNVAMHPDDEKDVKGSEVRTYSFGAERRFVMCEKRGKRKRGDNDPKPVRATFMLAHGSCGIMRGPAAQKKWVHGLPKMKGVKRSRISITPRM